MLLNEGFLFHLTPEEKKKYENLFVTRQETKEVQKVFRKEYNTLKAAVDKLEKRFGKSEEYDYKVRDNPQNNILGMIVQVKTKYPAIEHALYLSKERQKHFTKLLHKFPFDSINQPGSASSKLSALQSFITSAKDKIGEARHGISIANKYLKSLHDSLERKRMQEEFENKHRKQISAEN